jgi:hypothetical protein
MLFMSEMKKPTKQRWWIGEICCRARTTLLVAAASRAEAQEKLDNGEYECVDTTYYDTGPARVIRKDKASMMGIRDLVDDKHDPRRTRR